MRSVTAYSLLCLLAAGSAGCTDTRNESERGRPLVGRLVTRDGIIDLDAAALQSGQVPSRTFARVIADVPVDRKASFEGGGLPSNERVNLP